MPPSIEDRFAINDLFDPVGGRDAERGGRVT